VSEQLYRAYLARRTLVSGGRIPARWTRDGALWYVEGGPEDTVIQRVDPATGETAPLFDVAAVRASLAAATGHEPPYRGLPFDAFREDERGRVGFDYEGKRWRLDPRTNAVERLDDEPERLRPRTYLGRAFPYLVEASEFPERRSPNGQWFAGVRDHDVVLRSTKDGREQRLTHDGTLEQPWEVDPRDVVDPWSPDSATLFVTRRDTTGVFRMPRVNWLKPFEEVEYIPYQKAGARLDRIQPVLLDVRSGRQAPVQLGPLEDRYVSLLGWHGPDEALVIVYTRDLKRVDILAAHRETGAVRTLLTEQTSTFVKIQHEAWSGAHGFTRLPDGSGFLWESTRNGWNHLYRYTWDGELVGQLTAGDWPVHGVEHVGADGLVYFTAAIDSARPYDVHVCRTALAGGRVEQLTRERGIHEPSFAPGGTVFLDTHSSVDRPHRTELVRVDGTPLRVLSEMDVSRLLEIGYTPPEELVVQAADGETELWGVMYKPTGFDPSGSYPVIEYIYGGPQTITAQRDFSIPEHDHYALPWALAQLGYVVVCLDARGTPGRSKAFQDAVHGNWRAGIPDHVAAMRQLCDRHPFLDRSRIGIYGHSWGGYYSLCALIEAPDVYRASVSSAPGPDPWDMIIWEPYLDLPSRNRAAYDEANLVEQAHRVQGKLMLVVGTSDHANINTTMKLTRTLVDAGVEHELVVFPQAGHGFEGADQEYYLRKLTGWFERNVKSPG
jgi:dipeptidyl aminopeptidase/acylaminoacyl peptidase